MTDNHPLLHYAEAWPKEVEHISASSIKMLVRCPEQWRQRYVLGKRIPPAINMLAGRADHKAIESSMRDKMVTWEDWPVGDVRDLFVSELDREVEQEGGLGEIEFDKDTTTKPKKVKKLDELRKGGETLVAKYHTTVSPSVQPVMVEQEFTVDVPTLPVKMIGYIDLIAGYTDGSCPPDELRIIDRKRAGSARYQPEWLIQGEVYQYVYPHPHEWHLSVTTKGGYVLMPEGDKGFLPVPPAWKTARTVTHIAAEIGHYYSRYGPDEPWPSKGRLHPWACNYCGYRGGCWGWQTT